MLLNCSRITEEREPIIITQNGEARAVLVDVHSYEESQETMALLKILAIGDKEIEAGETYPIEDVIREIRQGRSPESELKSNRKVSKGSSSVSSIAE